MSPRRHSPLAAAGVAVLFLTACTVHHDTRPRDAMPSTATVPATTAAPSTAPDTIATSSGPVSARPPAAPPTAGGSGTVIVRCHTSQLRAEVVIPTHNGAAGQRYALLGLVNTGTACRMFGYPGLQARDAAARNLPTDARREPSPAPGTFVLGPGGTAWASLHWTIVPAGDEPGTNCEPPTAALWVTPPDETSQLSTAAKLGPICQHNQIDVGAMTPHRPF